MSGVSGSPRPVEGVRANGTLTDEALFDAIHMGDESWFWPVGGELVGVGDVLRDLQQTRIRLAAADRENAELREDVERLVREFDDAWSGGYNSAITQAGEAAKAEVERLDRQNADLRASNHAAIRLIREHGDVTDERDDARAQLAAAQAENTDLRRDVASLTEQIAATDARVVELVGQVGEARALVISLAVEDDPEQIARFRERFPSARTFDAALSAAPQPEPVTERSHQSGCDWVECCGPCNCQPEPPASDEPARCEHGRSEAHTIPVHLAGFGCCPGPAASGTPDGGQR